MTHFCDQSYCLDSHDLLERNQAIGGSHKPFTRKATWSTHFHRPGARFDVTEMGAYKTEDLKMKVCLHRRVDMLSKERNGRKTTI